MRSIDVLLARWVEWLRSGGGVTSTIGYPRATTEHRIIRNGHGGKYPASTRVPTWFWGVEESRIDRAIRRLPHAEQSALVLEWLWTSCQSGKHILPVSNEQRRRRWASETGRSPGTYHRLLRRAENMLVHDLLQN